MKIEKENTIEWKNGTSLGSPTYLNSNNLNKINTKTKEALELLNTKVENDFTEFEERLTVADHENQIIVEKAQRAYEDENGENIVKTYAKVADFNKFINDIQTGENVIGKCTVANHALQVTGAIDSRAVVLGEPKGLGTSDSTVATNEFVTKSFNKVLNDALE